MAMRDDLLAGESYFTAEVKSLKRIIDLMQKYHCTCFIDEILRGTNTIERIAASTAVLEYLHSQDCLCIVASHDIELTNILADKFDNYHFCEQIANDEVNFDYKLKSGPSTTRNAIKLLSLLGFDPEIVKSAENLSFEYDKKL
jgi:DNA mismatch repair ATPase MutS